MQAINQNEILPPSAPLALVSQGTRLLCGRRSNLMPQFWNYKHRIRRAERMRAARKLGTHTKEEWIALKKEFNGKCVRCLGESGLINVERDHIIPVCLGGSDAIFNIQPFCARCNSSKSLDCTNWAEIRRGQRGE